MIELKTLQQQVRALEADLTPTGSADPGLRTEWEQARTAQRTAATFETWLADRVTQVAVAWVLGTVFVRFAEDNGLVEDPYIAGPGDRTSQARELQQRYFQEHPERDDYDWLRESFAAMSVSPVAKGLFSAAHNPMWTIKPTPFAVKELLDFWRQPDENGALRYDLTDETWDTRFLGDLYQDLSEHAKKMYALLQTPVFVEEFILDYTLDPAIEEFGLDGLRTIDPACGSGHFLLGAFRRILAKWHEAEPGTDDWTLIDRTLSSVHGVDKNPFATAIARFRLMLAAMQAGAVTRLTSKVDFPLNIAVGDSLIHGYKSAGIQGEFDFGEGASIFTYRTEDIDDYIKSVRILQFGSYHAVFANPPYITVKDRAEADRYRELYPSCHRQYSLSVPFAERVFKLAVRGSVEGVGAGYTGQITANSFMKREFGKKLIEEFFTQVDLTHIIDTSGAYIPGHGTPTVIVFSRWRFPRRNSTIRAVLGIRGEPGQPCDPAKGLVWEAIVDQVDRPGSESEWVSVSDADRSQFFKYPWSLSGGGAGGLKELIESAPSRLESQIDEVGFGAVTRQDEAYMLGAEALRRARVSVDFQRPLVGGETVRDFSISNPTVSLWPYDPITLDASADDTALSLIWPYRTDLSIRVAYGQTQLERGLTWSEYSMFFRKRYKSPFVLAFAFVATHNHFVLGRGDNVFIRTAPVVKLRDGKTEDDHLALIAVLNSSTACFWLKQVSHNKGSQGINEGFKSQEWERFYEFTGTKLGQFPIPNGAPLERGRQIDTLAQQLAAVEPSAVCVKDVPSRDRLDAARVEYERVRAHMIALQEELDWDIYSRYSLLTDQEAARLIADPVTVPKLKLGERAFEIVMARRMAATELDTQWFARHRSTPITEIPKGWPEDYRRVVEERIEIITLDRNIGLIERPDCKRRWLSDPWEDKERHAVTTWLLDQCEDRALWYSPDGQPHPMTVNRLADRLRENPDVVAVARLLAGEDADMFDVLNKILANEHVPCLAQFRYKAEGLLKRALWEQTWNLQRQEDLDGKRLDIPVPPKYTSADFHRQSFWRHRGKLDVPKERFISYPGANPDADPSLLLGWAGWNHREQAAALITLIEARTITDAWDTARLTPLIAGLAEVMPWVRQWHQEVDPAFGQSPADAYDAYLTSQRETCQLTDAALASWKPPPTARGRRRA